MSNVIVKPFLHKKTPVLHPLSLQYWSLPLCDLRHDLVSNSDKQTVNRLTKNVVSYLVGPTPFPRVAPLSCSHTYTDLGADPGGSATDVVRHCPPWSVLIRHHPPSSQSHYGGYATFLLRTRYDLMLSDGGLAADWRRTSVVWRSTAAILLPWSVCVPPKSARKCSKSAQRRSSVAKVRS